MLLSVQSCRGIPSAKHPNPEIEQHTMPMFSKLFEMLPDVEQLLSLEPEELAGPLLVSLEGNQDIIPGNIIAYDSMSRVIQDNPHLKYPYQCREKVLFALMETWQ